MGIEKRQGGEIDTTLLDRMTEGGSCAYAEDEQEGLYIGTETW